MRRSQWRGQAAWLLVTLMGVAVTFQMAGAGLTTWVLGLALSTAFGLAVAGVSARLQVVPIDVSGSGTITFAATAGCLVAFAGTATFYPRDGLNLPIMAVTSFGIAMSAASLVCMGLALSLSCRRFGAFLAAWTAYLLLMALSSPLLFLGSATWEYSGPLVLFLVLLPLVNAPFDWFAVGLTRGLLRRGLEKGGWWPLAYAILDLIAAALTVVVLSIVILLAVQTFETLTTHTHWSNVVDSRELLSALANSETRSKPEYWWIYAMLFSTLLPSVVNVGLGTLSLFRGIPGLHEQLSKRMPIGREVLISERIWIAPILSIQVMLSGVIAIASMALLFWAILVWEVPYLGHSLLSFLQDLADAHLPITLFGVGPYGPRIPAP